MFDRICDLVFFVLFPIVVQFHSGCICPWNLLPEQDVVLDISYLQVCFSSVVLVFLWFASPGTLSVFALMKAYFLWQQRPRVFLTLVFNCFSLKLWELIFRFWHVNSASNLLFWENLQGYYMKIGWFCVFCACFCSACHSCYKCHTSYQNTAEPHSTLQISYRNFPKR